MKLTLVHYETGEKINVDAENPFTLGRGPLLNCNDKKVSRSHCLLQLTPDGELHIAALHKNPCFIMRNGSPPILQLLKDEEEILNDGDYIGLLHDSFWYRVAISKDEDDESKDVDESFLKKADSDSEIANMNFFKKGSIIKRSVHNEGNGNKCEAGTSWNELKMSQVETEKSLVNSKKSETDSRKSEDDVKKSNQSIVEKNKLKESCNVNNDVQDSSLMKCSSFEKEQEEVVKQSDSKVPYSESLNEKLKTLEKTKRLPLSMYQIDDFPEQNKLSSSLKAKTSSVTMNKRTDNMMCSGDTVPSILSDGEKQTDTKVLNVAKTSLKERMDSPGTSTEVSTNSVKPGNVNIKTEDVKVKEESSSNEVINTKVEKGNREMCQYEHSCYRKNEEHRKEFAHPGDSDFVPYENRPMCQYGAACYRTNKKHRVEYQHPKNGPDKKVKKPGGMTGTGSPKRKKKKVEYYDDYDDDEDEYDMDDPFMNDGTSDEYVPSDDSSGYMDSEADLTPKKPKIANDKMMK